MNGRYSNEDTFSFILSCKPKFPLILRRRGGSWLTQTYISDWTARYPRQTFGARTGKGGKGRRRIAKSAKRNKNCESFSRLRRTISKGRQSRCTDTISLERYKELERALGDYSGQETNPVSRSLAHLTTRQKVVYSFRRDIVRGC